MRTLASRDATPGASVPAPATSVATRPSQERRTCPNPILNDDRFKAAAAASDAQLNQANRAGWAAPQPGTQWNPPITDGPVSRYQGGVMTVAGTAQVTAILLGLLVVSGAFGWSAVSERADGTVTFPALSILGIFVGLGCVFGLMFRPQWAKWIAPIYAIAQGFAVGAISSAYESYQDGIVVQAVGATLGVFVVMLVLYRTKIIKVTERFKRIVIGATLGIMVFYGVSLLISLFGGNISFINSPSVARHRPQRAHRRGRRRQPGTRLRLHREGCPAGHAEEHGVVSPASACWSRSCGCTSSSCG